MMNALLRRRKPRVSNRIFCGDYVLASHFSDADPRDPWVIGFVWKIESVHDTVYYYVRSDDGRCNERGFKYCRKISPEFGREWLASYEADFPA